MFTCGWCGTHYTTWQNKCTSCGGPMPPLPGMELGQEPPPAPRELPRSFELKQKWLGNPMSLVGGIFMLVGGVQFAVFIFVLPLFSFIPLLFLALGGTIFHFGRKNAMRTLNAFQNGRAVKGLITEVHLDTTMRVNGQHPWRIGYSFQAVDGTTHEGFARTFDSSAQDRQRGQPIWVLVVDDNPEQNTIYPPVK